jgi:glutamine amidotransferase
MFIDVVDLGVGNVKSIKNLLSTLKLQTRSVSSPGELSSATLILPGVGSAGPYMEKMRESGLAEAVTAHALAGKNLIGICLGFQLLFDHSEEDGGVDGLGLIDGTVVRLGSNGDTRTHNGWRPMRFRRELLAEAGFSAYHGQTRKRVINGRVFYNHEYGVKCQEDDVSLMDIEGGCSAMAAKGNIVGMQFHPEKSQRTGLELMAMLL